MNVNKLAMAILLPCGSVIAGAHSQDQASIRMRGQLKLERSARTKEQLHVGHAQATLDGAAGVAQPGREQAEVEFRSAVRRDGAKPSNTARDVEPDRRQPFQQMVVTRPARPVPDPEATTPESGLSTTSSLFDVRTILAATGDPAPGASGLVFSGDFSSPRINANGDVAVIAGLTDPVTGDFFSSIWSNRTGSLQFVQMQGDPAPGTDGAAFALSSFDIAFDDDGTIYFHGFLTGGDVADCDGDVLNLDNEQGIWAARPNGIELLIREDGPLPNVGGTAHLHDLSSTVEFDIARDGSKVGFLATTRDGSCPDFGPSRTIFALDEGNGFGVLAPFGFASPVPGATYAATPFKINPSASDPNVLGFATILQGGDVQPLTDFAYIVSDNGNERLKVREFDSIPGFSDIFVGGGFGQLDASRRGDVHGFQTRLRDEGGNNLSTRTPDGILRPLQGVLVSNASDELRLLAKVGDPAPGVGSGGVFAFFAISQPVAQFDNVPMGTADDGSAAFHATLIDAFGFSQGVMVWHADASGSLTPVARQGQIVPGLDGVEFGQNVFAFENPFGPIAMNRSGQLAFQALLRTGEANALPSGLFFYDAPRDRLHKVLAAGDRVDLNGNGSDIRTVRAAAFEDSNQGSPTFNGTGLNDAGQLAFTAFFVDASGNADGSAVMTATFLGPQTCATHADCDDGLFCNGAEVCISGVCHGGTPPVCEDAVSCTEDLCDESVDACTFQPNNDRCSDGDTCTGVERCDPVLDCQDGEPPCPGEPCFAGICGCNFNRVCEEGEDCDGCLNDCPSFPIGTGCGNGVCETAVSEDCQNCPADCNGRSNGRIFCCGLFTTCSDSRCNDDGFVCDANEPASTCCGDGVCESPFESDANCPIDCDLTSVCGDGVCEVGEICTCVDDCGEHPIFEDACDDGLDNDCDGGIDCADGNCFNTPACAPPQCMPKGLACDSDFECCSRKCRGGRCK